MRLRWLSLSLALGMGFVTFGSTAHAASNTEYLRLRAQTTLTTLDTTDQLTDQFAYRAGQVVEIEGTVSGIFSGDDRSGFLLRLPGGQTVIATSNEVDPDISVGNTLRVMARIPAQGSMLEAVKVTPAGANLAQADLANLRVNEPATRTDDPFAGAGNPVIQNLPDPAVNNAAPAPVEHRSLAQRPEVVREYAQAILKYNARLDGALAEKIAYHILDKSERHGVDPRLTFALVAQESRFNPNAVSHAGAQGLGQLMPGTADSLGVRNAFDIEDNLDGTVRYLVKQLRAFGYPLGLAAYNAGPGNVKRYGGIPPFRETQNYVRVISNNYAALSGYQAE